MYDKIRVDTTVVNDDCNTSSGAYKIRARTHGPDGAVDTREFIEQWQRDVAAEIEQTHVYEMSGDATLLWMKVGISRSTACNCVVPSEPEFP